MPVTIIINSNVKELISKFKWYQKSQFPFIYAKTLTETAEAARQGVGIQSRRVFKLQTEFIPRNIRKESAKKNDFERFGFAEAAVMTGHKLDGWMGLHEEGGIKKPKRKSIALPGKDIKKRKFKTRSGKIRKRWSPGQLLKDYKSKGRSISISRGGRKRTPFVIRGGTSGVPMIVRRRSKKRYPLEILYVFAKEAHINREWGFEKTVRFVVNKVFKKKFEKNFRKEFPI